MGHASGARAMRQISSQNVDKDVKTAVLAVYLVRTVLQLHRGKFRRELLSFESLVKQV
jgi:hypothetical protein